MILFFIVFLVALYMVAAIFFFEPMIQDTDIREDATLKVDVIDELEYWIEERQREGQDPILNPGRNYFRS